MAFELSVTCVSESTETTVVPGAKLVLVTVIPGRRPKALMPRTIAEPEVIFVKVVPLMLPKVGLPLA